MVGGIGGQIDAALGVQRGDPRRARRHPLADQAGRRGRVVLEDQDARAPMPTTAFALVDPARRR